MTRDSLEMIRATSVACNAINEPVHVQMPTSAKMCEAVNEYNDLKKNNADDEYDVTQILFYCIYKKKTRVKELFQ